MRSNHNGTGNGIGAFFVRMPLRYRSLLWLLAGVTLWRVTGSWWFLVAATPAAILMLLMLVNSLLMLGKRGDKAPPQGDATIPAVPAVAGTKKSSRWNWFRCPGVG